MKRIFAGIKIDPDAYFIELLSSIRKQLAGERIKFTDPANMHVTLVFPGETPEERIDIVKDILRDNCERRGTFQFSIKGAGVFKNLHDPKIFWAGISHSDALIELQSDMHRSLVSAGFPLEERAFSPHLTIARIKSIANMVNLKKILEKYQSAEIQQVRVEKVTLFESILKHDGPVYKPLAEYML